MATNPEKIKQEALASLEQLTEMAEARLKDQITERQVGIDSIAASLFVWNWLSWQIVIDDKIQITILILRRGALSTSEPWIWIWTWFLQEHGNRRGKYKKCALPWHLQVGHIGLVWVQGNAISDYDYHHLSSQLPLLSRRLRWKERADTDTAPTSCFTSQPLKIFLLWTGWKLQRFHLFQLPDNARR